MAPEASEVIKPGEYINGKGLVIKVLGYVILVEIDRFDILCIRNYGEHAGQYVAEPQDIFASELKTLGFKLREPKET